MPSVDDYDVTFFNGVQVGKTGPEVANSWQKPRKYAVPADSVKAGKNVIATGSPIPPARRRHRRRGDVRAWFAVKPRCRWPHLKLKIRRRSTSNHCLRNRWDRATPGRQAVFTTA